MGSISFFSTFWNSLCRTSIISSLNVWYTSPVKPFSFCQRTTFAFHMNCRISLSVSTKMFALIVIRIARKLYINLERTACDEHCHLSLYLTKYFVSLYKSFQLNLLFLPSNRSKCNCKKQHREIPHVLYPLPLVTS